MQEQLMQELEKLDSFIANTIDNLEYMISNELENNDSDIAQDYIDSLEAIRGDINE